MRSLHLPIATIRSLRCFRRIHQTHHSDNATTDARPRQLPARRASVWLAECKVQVGESLLGGNVMKVLMTSLLLIAVASFVAGQPQMPQMKKGQMMTDCPMSVQGAEIAVADTPDGIALTWTTKTGNVDELRRRVERMAAMHASQADKPSAMTGGMMAGIAKYELIAGGARLTLTPKDPAKLAEFRKQVRSHVERMSKEGSCPMMQ